MRAVLFVCTGNIFRSMSAEYCLKEYLRKRGVTDVTVGSAGIEAHPEQVSPHVREALAERGIDCAGHEQRKLDRKLLDGADIVIAMSKDHVSFIKERFGKDVPLFDEVALGTATSVWDAKDRANGGHGHETERAYIRRVVRHIHECIPKLAENIL